LRKGHYAERWVIFEFIWMFCAVLRIFEHY
jgi:hypothetical protein